VVGDHFQPHFRFWFMKATRTSIKDAGSAHFMCGNL